MRSPRPTRFLSILLPFALGAICTLASYLAAGVTAGLFFSGFIFATLLVPPLSQRTDEIFDQLLSLAAVAVGIVIVWGATVALETDLTLKQWIACSMILTCYAGAIAGGTFLLRAVRLSPFATSAMVMVVGTLWLAWPIWLSPALAGRDDVVAWLTPAHPLLAVDHIAALGSPWTEHRLMYNQLSILNQDVPYSMPSTILWTCAVHGCIALAGAVVLFLRSPARLSSGDLKATIIEGI